MTFTVVTVSDNRERMLGTIWAAGESDAQQIASSLFPDKGEAAPERLVVRRAEEREIPLRLMN
jgi:hypothetical protein